MFNIAQLKAFVEANPKLVTRRESVTYPGLFVLKYTRKVFYDNLWDAAGILKECRGMVVDENYKPVIVPFTKIFNRNENGADIPLDEQVTCVMKINGFMAAATYTKKYGVIVSTTGSLDSDFVKLAKKHLDPVVVPWIAKNAQEGLTFVFEICDETDPHIIEEAWGAYLIGVMCAFYTRSGDLLKHCYFEDTIDGLAIQMSKNFDDADDLESCIPEIGEVVMRPEWFRAKFGDIMQMMPIQRHEGWVVYGKETVLKIKSPHYLVKKLFARKKNEYLSPDWLVSCKQTIDEEFYPLVDFITEDLDFFKMLDEPQKLKYIEKFLTEEEK